MSRALWLSILGLGGLLATGFEARAQSRNTAYIGYVYPAGGQTGTTFQVTGASFVSNGTIQGSGEIVTPAAGLTSNGTITVGGSTDTLTITGEKKLPAEEDVTYIRHERPHGTFRRLIDLPYSIAQDEIKASYKDGVLTITLPKAEEAKPTQIAVE